MQKIRAVFDAPKDCSNEFLHAEFRRSARKFIDHFEAEGWVLKSDLDFYCDFGRSGKDAEKNHYVIVGYFHPLNKKEDKREVIEVPDSIAQKLIQKFGSRVHLLN